jgi:hypothetical protein
MIDLHDTWIPQILAHAELVAEEGVLRRAWLEGKRTETSVIDFDELLEQVLGDSDAEQMLDRARIEHSDKKLVAHIEAFITTLLALDKKFKVSPPAEVILNSGEWNSARVAAKELLKYADAGGYTF